MLKLVFLSLFLFGGVGTAWSKEVSCPQLERKLKWLEKHLTRKNISFAQRREEKFQYKKIKRQIEDHCLSLDRKLEQAFTKSNLIDGQ